MKYVIIIPILKLKVIDWGKKSLLNGKSLRNNKSKKILFSLAIFKM